MKNIILIGAGGHAKSCIEIFHNLKDYRISYVLDEKLEGKFLGYRKLIYNKKNLINIYKKIKNAFICFGQIKNLTTRKKIFN